jgi:hypothetical protein
MTINKHNEYSASLKCYDCHVPRGSSMGLATTLNCLTSGCHGELAPDINHEEAIALKDKVWNYYPDARARIEHYLELHRAFAEDSCSSCHSEHQRMPIRIPDGWLRYEDMIKQRPADDQQASSEWRSVRSIGG